MRFIKEWWKNKVSHNTQQKDGNNNEVSPTCQQNNNPMRPLSQYGAELEGPVGGFPVNLDRLTDGYKLRMSVQPKLFLVTLKNGQQSEITARSLLHAGELSEKDYGCRNIQSIEEVSGSILESPIDLNEEHLFLPSNLPSFQPCSQCLYPDVCRRSFSCINIWT